MQKNLCSADFQINNVAHFRPEMSFDIRLRGLAQAAATADTSV